MTQEDNTKRNKKVAALEGHSRGICCLVPHADGIIGDAIDFEEMLAMAFL